ncbi:TraB/GumN family protein [Brevundimonas sp.]|jgi:hypothetical protein|uniref:TraB/GumN family protein n=1 Tax=Brevundimonas sp. TaxID=1871086 RepID=UPI0037C088CE
MRHSKINLFLGFLGFWACVAVSTGAIAQETVPEAASDEVEEIVVSARRIEGPMWQVRRGDSVLILVTPIDLPKDMEWRTEALVSAVDRADRVLFPVEGRGSLADIGRMIWRFRTLTRLPDGRTSADYLSPELEARVEALTGEGPSRQSFWLLADDLMEIGGGGGGQSAANVVRRATRANRTPARAVGTLRGDELVDKILTTPPEQYRDCIAAAVIAGEAGPQGGAKRAEDWRMRRVPALRSSPLQQAVDACSYFSIMGQSDTLRRIWNTAVEESLAQTGATVAIAPLVVVTEPGGVLDMLEGQGLEIIGPDWKAAPAP